MVMSDSMLEAFGCKEQLEQQNGDDHLRKSKSKKKTQGIKKRKKSKNRPVLDMLESEEDLINLN